MLDIRLGPELYRVLLIIVALQDTTLEESVVRALGAAARERGMRWPTDGQGAG